MKRAKAQEVVSLLVRQLFTRYGPPKKLLSDNGSQFTSKVMKAIMEEWGVEHLRITPYHAQANWVERVNRNLKGMLKCYVDGDHQTWDVHVPEFQFALNSAYHETLKYTPAEVMLGRSLQSVIARKWEIGEAGVTAHNSDFLRQVADNTAQRHSRAKEYYDKHRRSGEEFTVGKQVLLKTHYQSDAKKHFSAKLAPRWQGPFEIVRKLSPVNFVIADSKGKGQTVHMDSLKLSHQVDP